MLNEYDFFVFDCDGVILCSNQMKSDAFALALDGEKDEDISAFIHYHRVNGGISRYQKFSYYFEKMVPRHNAQEYIKNALLKYASIVKQGLVECQLVPGVRQFLTILKDRGVACAVNSGGDEHEINMVFEQRGLDHYFQYIYGSPCTKRENMLRLYEAGFMSKSGIMFGDSKSDWDAACDAGLDFIFVAHESEWEEGSALSQGNVFFGIDNFSSLE